jgi:dGTPase
MPCTRVDLEKRERLILAPYAQFSADTRGRKYKEDPPEWRTHYQRDRDRVIHSRAFRRLEYKTQVFLNGTGDHLRTRLTHTMEVAAISRNIARALRLNEDLTETIALAHDLGHSAFGHKGETALNQLMKNHGGFEHNRQSLRVVDLLEQKYPLFPGLNLSWEVREGLSKHLTAFDQPKTRAASTRKTSQRFPLSPPRGEGRGEGSVRQQSQSPSLEAQVANLGDEITYYSHDLDDGLTSRLLSEEQLNGEVKIWAEAARGVKRDYGDLPDECRRYFIIRCIIDSQVKDVVHTTETNIADVAVKTANDVRAQSKPLVQYSLPRREENLELREYLYENVYFSPEVYEPNRRAIRMLEELFQYYLENRQSFGDSARKRARKDGWPRVVCDYLGGMTDRFAIQEHQRLFGLKV